MATAVLSALSICARRPRPSGVPSALGMNGALARRQVRSCPPTAGLRKLTLVEVASGHDMTVSDLPSLLDEQSSAQESPGLSRGERSTVAYSRASAGAAAGRPWVRKPNTSPTTSAMSSAITEPSASGLSVIR